MSAPAGIRFRDRAVYLPAAETLVVTDLHLGRAKTAAIEAPLDSAVQIRQRLTALLETYEPARVVLAGDVLDSFDALPDGVEPRLQRILAAIEAGGATVIVLRGNHDTMLSTVYDGAIRDRDVLDGTVICHGHELPPTDAERYLIGHEHPALRIEGVKRPCYLFGRGIFEGADVLVLPAFSRLISGTTMNTRQAGDCHSPLLQAADLDRFRPIVRDEAADETLTFPRFGALRSFL